VDSLDMLAVIGDYLEYGGREGQREGREEKL
jgi:hypothetical protein